MAYSIVRPIGCYVYTHRKATTGDIFYVGKGTAERAWDKCGRNVLWQRIVSKHGYSIHIEDEGLLEFEAHARERDLIFRLRGMGLRLANLTDGGEGSLNPSLETRLKISMAHRGKKKTLEHIEKIRQSNIGKKRSDETRQKIRGRIVPDETRKKMSASACARDKPTSETRERLSVATILKWKDAEYRLKVKNGTTGKKRDDSFRARMSTIAKLRPPIGDEEREQIRREITAKWADPDYRERMRAAHVGKGWSEARRKAHENGDPQQRSENAKAARARLAPELRSKIASIAAKAGKAARDKKAGL